MPLYLLIGGSPAEWCIDRPRVSLARVTASGLSSARLPMLPSMVITSIILAVSTGRSFLNDVAPLESTDRDARIFHRPTMQLHSSRRIVILPDVPMRRNISPLSYRFKLHMEQRFWYLIHQIDDLCGVFVSQNRNFSTFSVEYVWY